MRKQLILLYSLFWLVACNSCVPQPAPAPPPDPVAIAGAGPVPVPTTPPEPPPNVVVDAGPPVPEPAVDPSVKRACDNLAALHCAEGMTGCYRVLQHAVDAQLTPVPLGCLVGAHSKTDVHACGRFVACK